MKHYEVVATLIDQGDNYCFELRVGASNGDYGLLGFFGGSVEEGEELLEAACREVREESNLTPQPDDLEFIREVDVISDRDNQTITVHGRIYRLKVDPSFKVEARVGEAVVIPKDKVQQLDTFSPLARAFFEAEKE